MLRDVYALAELRSGAAEFQIAVRLGYVGLELQKRIVLRAAGFEQLARRRDDFPATGEPALAVLLTRIPLGHELDLHVLRIRRAPDAVMIGDEVSRAADK